MKPMPTLALALALTSAAHAEVDYNATAAMKRLNRSACIATHKVQGNLSLRLLFKANKNAPSVTLVQYELYDQNGLITEDGTWVDPANIFKNGVIEIYAGSTGGQVHTFGQVIVKETRGTQIGKLVPAKGSYLEDLFGSQPIEVQCQFPN